MHKDVDIHRKQLPCDMLYMGRTRSKQEGQENQTQFLLYELLAKKQSRRTCLQELKLSRPALWRNKADLL